MSNPTDNAVVAVIAVVAADGPLAACSAAERAERLGVDSDRTGLVIHAGLAAVVVRMAAAELAPVAAHLARWLALLETVAQAGPSVPMRFGQQAEDDGEVERFLACRSEHLRGLLGTIGSCAEVAIRRSGPEPEVSVPQVGQATGAAGSGRAFLNNRKAVLVDSTSAAASSRLALDVRQHVTELPDMDIAAIRSIRAEPPTPRLPWPGISVLVERSVAAGLAASIRSGSLAGVFGSGRVTVSRPLPPLSFVAAGPEDVIIETKPEAVGGGGDLTPRRANDQP